MVRAEERRRTGWVPRTSNPHDHADVLHFRSFGLGRSWSPFTDDELTRSPGFLHAILIVEGSITFTTDDGQLVAPSGSVTLLDGAREVRAVTRTPSARFSWYFAPTALPPDRALLPVGRSVEMSEQPRNTLVSATNAILNAPSEMHPDAAEYLGLSFAYLLAAGLVERNPQTMQNPSHGSLLEQARAVIEHRFHDPDLTVERLAQEVNVSRSALHAAFAESGSTPRRQLEQRRIQEARRLRMDGRLSSRDIADLTGFASATHLLRTLRRAETKRTNGRGEHTKSTR